MSQEERDELEWLKRVQAGSITQREAAEKLGMSDRWVRTLVQRMSQRGDAVVVHGLRGRPSIGSFPSKRLVNHPFGGGRNARCWKGEGGTT